MSRSLLAFALGAILSAPSSAEPPDEALDLASAVAFALEHNAGLAAAIEQRHELEGGLVEAWSDAYPQLDVNAGWSSSRNPALLNSPDFADFIDQFPAFEPRTQDLWTLGFELRQVIWAGGKVKATVALAKLAAETVESRIQAARLDIAARAATSFAEVIAADRAREAIRAELRSREAALELVEARFEIGEATELDRLRAIAARHQLGPDLAELDGRFESALAGLRAVMGLPAAAALELDWADRAPPPLPELESALAEALERRPELLGLALEARTVAGQAELTRAEGRPRFDFLAGWGRQARLGENLRDGLYDDWRIGITASVSLSDGGRRAGQLAQAASRERQIELRLEDLARQVELEVEAAWADLRAALARREAATAALAAAREAARVARESWELGVALQLDVLEADDLARRSELGAIETELAAWSAAIALDRARGRVTFDERDAAR